MAHISRVYFNGINFGLNLRPTFYCIAKSFPDPFIARTVIVDATESRVGASRINEYLSDALSSVANEISSLVGRERERQELMCAEQDSVDALTIQILGFFNADILETRKDYVFDLTDEFFRELFLQNLLAVLEGIDNGLDPIEGHQGPHFAPFLEQLGDGHKATKLRELIQEGDELAEDDSVVEHMKCGCGQIIFGFFALGFEVSVKEIESRYPVFLDTTRRIFVEEKVVDKGATATSKNSFQHDHELVAAHEDRMIPIDKIQVRIDTCFGKLIVD